ncbi:hypothetical protein OIPHN330_19680 [Citrobacter freundii]|nr:hypothetical protein OIPHN330_19680 [Citrobacter freundii]BEJ39246.1 hypothetical protein OIPHN354_19580 [Citrobacter freundii]
MFAKFAMTDDPNQVAYIAELIDQYKTAMARNPIPHQHRCDYVSGEGVIIKYYQCTV